jgi:hypothetical protein
VCGKAARTVLCGGRAMKRTSLPLQRREFIAGLGSAVAWPVVARAQPAGRENGTGRFQTPAGHRLMGGVGAGVAGHPNIPKREPVPFHPAPR